MAGADVLEFQLQVPVESVQTQTESITGFSSLTAATAQTMIWHNDDADRREVEKVLLLLKEGNKALCRSYSNMNEEETFEENMKLIDATKVFDSIDLLRDTKAKIKSIVVKETQFKSMQAHYAQSRLERQLRLVGAREERDADESIVHLAFYDFVSKHYPQHFAQKRSDLYIPVFFAPIPWSTWEIWLTSLSITNQSLIKRWSNFTTGKLIQLSSTGLKME